MLASYPSIISISHIHQSYPLLIAWSEPWAYSAIYYLTSYRSTTDCSGLNCSATIVTTPGCFTIIGSMQIGRLRCEGGPEMDSSPTLIPVRLSYQSDFYTSPNLVSVRLSYQSEFHNNPNFVPVRLIQSNVRISYSQIENAV
jgi:hypothetical protein